MEPLVSFIIYLCALLISIFRDANLGTASWAFNNLDVLETVAVNSLSGTFALFEVPMEEADYWVTVSLNTLSPNSEDPEDDNMVRSNINQ